MQPHMRCLPALVVLLLVVGCSAPSTPATTSAAPPTVIAEAAPAVVQSVEAIPTPTAVITPTPRADQQAQNMKLVGALQLDPVNRDAHGDVASYKNLAFVGTSGSGSICPPHGVHIIDISDPAQPVLLANSPPRPDVMMEDMAAMEIAGRDVLVIGLQPCGQAPVGAGLDLIDITEPGTPQRIGFFQTNDRNGVHEFGLTTAQDGRVLAVLALPAAEARSADDAGRGGTGDLLIIDISDPTQPQQIAEWGVLDEPQLGPAFALATQTGAFPGTYLHSVRASADGTRAFLSYWDAGVILLDISNPVQPRYLSRTTYTFEDEGNAHSTAVSPDGTLLVVADEDVDSTYLALTSNAYAGEQAVRTRLVGSERLQGEVVPAGRGCPAETVAEQPTEDVYTHEISGTIALLDPGGCNAEYKVARAFRAHAKAVILYGGSELAELDRFLNGSGAIKLPDGSLLAITIPVAVVSQQTGRALAEGQPPVTVELGTTFDGWGGLRFFDISDPTNPIQLSTFATKNTYDEALTKRRRGDWWTAHNPEIANTMVFASWYSDGVRAIDITDPREPREVGFWAGANAGAAPPVDIWGIALHNDVILASDRNFGLYILQLSQ